MKNDSIELSNKHGVNPSMQRCFYCGNDKGIILFGRLKDDKEAPKEVISDLEPCDECSDLIKHPKENNCAILIEYKNDGPTGRYVVVKDHILNEDVLIGNEKRIFFVENLPIEDNE